MPASKELKADVLSSGTCSLCGACMGWCPYIKNLEDHLVLAWDCGVCEGRCYEVCPRTPTDWHAVAERCSLNWLPGETLGSVSEIWKSRAKQKIAGQQDGGTITALLLSSFARQEYSVALLDSADDEYKPNVVIAHSSEDIIKAAGSRFLASAGLSKLMKAAATIENNLVVVGRPCQMQGLRKIQNYAADKGQTFPKTLGIGLFCMWSLNWSFQDDFMKHHPNSKIQKIRIPQHAVAVDTNQGTVELPISFVKEFIRSGCRYCQDMSSEMADISVGAFEAGPGWNTVLIRTKSGAEQFHNAVQGGYLEAEIYPVDEYERLKSAAYNKKVRTLELLRKSFDKGLVKPFINLADPLYSSQKNSPTKEETD